MKTKLVITFILLIAMLCIPMAAFGSNVEEHTPTGSSPSSNTGTGVADGQSESSAPVQQSDFSTPETDKAQSDSSMDYTQYAVDSFNILNLSTGEVMEIPVEEYVLGAVMSEMPASYELEALKAQAVAAHTYALYNKLSNQNNPDPALNGADFSADPGNYQGFMTQSIAQNRFGSHYQSYYDKIAPAVAEVIDQILVYDDEPIVAVYHALSAGKTEDASNIWTSNLDYLVPVESIGDRLSSGYETFAVFSSSHLRELTEKAFEEVRFTDGEEKNWIEVMGRSESGYVTQVRVGNITIGGNEMRTLLDLRSSHFTVSYADGNFRFDVLGYGHGVGLSQYGSDYFARQGMDYEDILLHYYQGAKLVSVR